MIEKGIKKHMKRLIFIEIGRDKVRGMVKKIFGKLNRDGYVDRTLEFHRDICK